MRRQSLNLSDYGWRITVFYDTTPNDAWTVIEALEDIGCAEQSLERALRSMTHGGDNCGLTYTNVRLRESVMVIGNSTTLAQFLNTAWHELTHACRHICEHLSIDPFSEEAAYLAGDLSGMMHPVLEEFICDCMT